MKKQYEVVISGIAGTFPESHSVLEFEENLFKKKDLITNNDRKWNRGTLDMPSHTGKIKDDQAMDHSFFGIGTRLFETLDPHIRQSLEYTFAAIADAGMNPWEMRTKRTAALACSCVSESEYESVLYYRSGLRILGSSRSMQSNRMAFHLNLTGPSYTIDNSWCGGAEGLRYAHQMISNGSIDSAVVVGCSLLYLPEVSYHYTRMGRLNKDGVTKCFCDNADGYTRSEACVALFLQRKDEALRSYGTLLGSFTDIHGSKPVHFPEISRGKFENDLKRFYSGINVDPKSVAYIEGAGVASKEVDAEELNTISNVMLEGRKDPLLIGCVKSNAGHCEAASDMVGVAKALIALNTGLIPPNLHYNDPNSLVPTLLNGRLKVVTEPTELPGDLVGVNSISVNGSFAHVALKRFEKEKKEKTQVGVLPPDGIPRLFVICGRNLENTEKSIAQVESMPVDAEWIALSHQLFQKGIKNHMYRAFTVINDANLERRESATFWSGQAKTPLWFVFTGMGSQWPGMGRCLMKLPIFAKAINHCHEVLKPKGIDIIDIITTTDNTIFDNILHSFVGIAAVQIGLVDVLYELGIKPDGIIGHSVGELGCAYADGCLTAEQMLLAAYARGKASIETELIPGMMAAVGKGYNQMKKIVPEGIEVACHNSKDSCTLSGPTQLMEEFINDLKAKNVFAKLVNVSNIAYHSRYIRPAAPALLKYLKEVIPKPLKRSSKWISTSVSEDHWDSELAQYCSAEYHTNNLLSSVLFEEGSKHVPQDAVIIEISPHGLLQAILKRSFPEAYHVPLTRRGDQNGLVYLFNAIGKLYLKGMSLNLDKVYPPVEYPVSRGTPNLGHLINWEHTNVHQHLQIFRDITKISGLGHSKKEARNIKVGQEGRFNYLKEYQLKGVPVIPLGSYLNFVIDELKNYEGSEINFVQIKGVKFNKYVQIESDDYQLFTSLTRGTGRWQICDEQEEVVHATITSCDKFTAKQPNELVTDASTGEVLYENFRQLGLNLGPSFKLIKAFTETEDGVTAVVRWTGSLVTFLESVLMLPLVGHKRSGTLYKVWRVGSIRLDLQEFASKEERDVTVVYSNLFSSIHCKGLEIIGTKLAPVFQNLKTGYKFQEAEFLPYESTSVNNEEEFLRLVKDVVISNIAKYTPFHSKLNIFEIEEGMTMHEDIYKVFNRVPGININNSYLSEDKNLGEIMRNQQTFDNVLIVTASARLENAKQVLRNSNQGFVLLKDEQVPDGFGVVLEKSVGPHLYTLCTLEKKNNDMTNYVFLSEGDWEPRLESTLKNSSERQVTYLVGSIQTPSRIRQIIEKCNDLYNSKQLRFLFHDLFLATERVQPLMFQEQLNKGLRVNVFSRGRWGTVYLREMDLPTLPAEIVHYPTYKLSELRLDGVEIESLALNLLELSGKSNETGVVEYSGTQNGTNVCGIAFLDEKRHTIEPDPILRWEKPSNWTHDQVTSVLLPYAMASFIIREIEDTPLVYLRSRKMRILVHRGVLPLSQAVIDLSLRQRYLVYTTYIDQQERQTIKQLFPQIPDENIVSLANLDALFKLSEGGYMNCVVNTFPDQNILKASTEHVNWNGLMFQTTFDSPQDKSLGMNMFLRAVRVHGLKPSSVLIMDDEYKRILQKEVEILLKENSVKPLLYRTTPFQTIDYDAAESLRDPKFIGQRLIVSKETTLSNKSLLYFCDPEANYLIIVKDQGQIWVCILEWLVRRGAKRISIALDWGKQLQFVPIRLNSIMEMNPDLNVNIHSEELLSSPSLLQTFINGIKTQRKLAAIFLTGEERPENLSTICEVIEDARMLYISDKFHEEFENQSRNGLIIVDKSNSLYSDALLPVIDNLMQTTTKFVTIIDCNVSTTTIVVDNSRTAYSQHLPWSVEEVISLARSTGSAAWKEVRTDTMVAENCYGQCPILVIPSLKKGVMANLYKKLFNPAYEAILPDNATSLEEFAQHLYQGTKMFNNDVFTVVCSDWSYLLGLSLARLLEADNKQVIVVCFGSLLRWDSQVLYHAVYQKVRDEMASDCPTADRAGVEKGLEILKSRIEFISRGLKEVDTKIKSTVILVKTDTASHFDIESQLQEHCDSPVVVQHWEGKYLEVMGGRVTADLINRIALIDHRDRATDIEYYKPIDKFYRNPRRRYIVKLANMLRK